MMNHGSRRSSKRVIAAFLVALAVYEIQGAEEDTVAGKPVLRYNTSSILQNINAPRPPVSSTDDQTTMTPTKHLQYAVFLDQLGTMEPNTGLIRGDPEAPVIMSDGEFSTPETKYCFRWIPCGRVVQQRFNRCRGGYWPLYWDDVETVAGRRLLATGKEFFERLSDDDECILIFEWSDETFTSAIIKGYVEEWWGRLGFLARFFTLRIDLMPYWAWKFDLPQSTSKLEELEAPDLKCCPPKENGPSCLGGGALANNNDCETISVACNTPTDIGPCAMWKRRNLLRRFIPLLGFASYYAYPVGDKNREPTGFFSKFEEVMLENGINQIFHGV